MHNETNLNKILFQLMTRLEFSLFSEYIKYLTNIKHTHTQTRFNHRCVFLFVCYYVSLFNVQICICVYVLCMIFYYVEIQNFPSPETNTLELKKNSSNFIFV